MSVYNTQGQGILEVKDAVAPILSPQLVTANGPNPGTAQALARADGDPGWNNVLLGSALIFLAYWLGKRKRG